MSLLTQKGFEEHNLKKALDMLLTDRKNEFRELAEVVFWNNPASMSTIKESEMFILNFCLDVSEAFKSWSGQKKLEITSAMMTLTLLRQLSQGRITMTQVAHLLNISYTIAEEFKVIYKRLS